MPKRLLAGGVSSHVGSGGMITKVRTAAQATRSGTAIIIVSGHEPDLLLRLHRGEALGTYFHPRLTRLTRPQALAGQLRAAGTLHLDAGAAQVLRKKGGSLLPVGVTAAEGRFQRGDLVVCLDPKDREVGRAWSISTRRWSGNARGKAAR
ncbi:PUA domain-containing protein [Acidithiobacillus sp. M4-SHS-6]|uniref:PUA domain-containing protein n=1 Tax=Acidithiobacillus sp. M4-SHS-6 TaxID=3383024 RepID=UPI0039BE7DBC